MKALKIIGIVLLVYVGIVVLFESAIGYIQPADASTLVITTYGPDGSAHERVVSRLESDDQLYVAANHWPRAWYRRVLANPKVRVAFDGKTSDRKAVPVTGAEYERVDAEHHLPLAFRFVTGFPPRKLLRLEPIVPPPVPAS